MSNTWTQQQIVLLGRFKALTIVGLTDVRLNAYREI